MGLLKPILKIPEDHPMSHDVEQKLTIDMVQNAEMVKNELAEDDLPCIWGPNIGGNWYTYHSWGTSITPTLLMP